MLAFPMVEDFSFEFLSKIFRTNVLVVEDDPVLKPIMSGILDSIDSHTDVQWVKTAELAIKRLKSQRYGLVISDYFLEGPFNGLDLYHHCQTKFPRMPFLLMSGIDQAVVQKLVTKGQRPPAFLQKPFLIEDCLKTVSEVLYRKGY